MNRMVSLEAATFDHKLDCQAARIESAYGPLDPSTFAAIAFQALADTDNGLATYRRFDSTRARQHDRAARRLENWQARRKKLKNEQHSSGPAE